MNDNDRVEENRIDKIRIDTRKPLTVQKITDDEDKPVREKKTPTDLKGSETFWNMYPNKKNKGEFLAQWRILSPEERELALVDVPKKINSIDWQKDNGMYIPMPSNYLKNKRWLDEVKTKAPIKSYGVKK